MEVYPKWIVTTSDKPIMLEVFTNSADESVALDRFRNIVPPPKGQQIKEQIKITVKELVGNDILTQVKKIIKNNMSLIKRILWYFKPLKTTVANISITAPLSKTCR